MKNDAPMKKTSHRKSPTASDGIAYEEREDGRTPIERWRDKTFETIYRDIFPRVQTSRRDKAHHSFRALLLRAHHVFLHPRVYAVLREELEQFGVSHRPDPQVALNEARVEVRVLPKPKQYIITIEDFAWPEPSSSRS